MSKIFFSISSLFSKHPNLSGALIYLSIPLILLVVSGKFATPSIEGLVLFSIIGVLALAYSAWIASIFFTKTK